MGRRGFLLIFVVVLCFLSAAPAGAQDHTGICAEVFSGDQGNVGKAASAPARNNGDGTYTLSYTISYGRPLPNLTADALHDCAFVDENANSRHDAGETLEALSIREAKFTQASSSIVIYRLTMTIAASPGDRVCDRAQVENSNGGAFVDRTGYVCEVLGAAVEVPMVTGPGLLLGGGLLAVACLGFLVTRRLVVVRRQV